MREKRVAREESGRWSTKKKKNKKGNALCLFKQRVERKNAIETIVFLLERERNRGERAKLRSINHGVGKVI